MLHLVTSSIDSLIRRAIAQKHLIEVSYKGRRRIAEPHDYGRFKGIDRLLVYQVGATGTPRGKTTGWRLLDVPKIESLAILDAIFDGTRSQADQSHHPWDEIYARVK